MGPRGACQHAQYSTGIYIRKLFTSAHDEICQDFVPSAARRSSPLFPFLSLSSFHLFFSFFLLVLSPCPSHQTLRFCSHLPPTWSGERHAQRGEGCPLLSYPSFPLSGAQLHLGINQACVGNEHGEILIFGRAAASTRLAVANLVSVFI